MLFVSPETPAAAMYPLSLHDALPISHLLAQQLAKAGFASDVATTGAEVIERAAEARYAAILNDLELPDSDGISVVQRLRAQPEDRKSTRLNSSHTVISYAVFCLKKKE